MFMRTSIHNLLYQCGNVEIVFSRFLALKVPNFVLVKGYNSNTNIVDQRDINKLWGIYCCFLILTFLFTMEGYNDNEQYYEACHTAGYHDTDEG